MKVLFSLKEKEISSINKSLFNDILLYLRENNLDSDRISSAELSKVLKKPPVLSPEEFAQEIIYVILASGFSQRTAIKKWREIMTEIHSNGANFDKLIQIFKNQTKIKSIVKAWENKKEFRDGFYNLRNENRPLQEQVDYLETIPYIGKTTKNHLARNLGISIVKYDVWIQRLGIALKYPELSKKETEALIKFPVTDDVKAICDDIFNSLEEETGESRGFIDVILWKACQLEILSIK